MAIKPILFSTPMVQGIKKNIKKQTRRAIKFPLKSKTHHISVGEGKEAPHVSFAPVQTGDILWVRETWTDPTPDKSGWPILYKADFPMVYHGTQWDPNEVITLKAEDYKWKPSIFMPKEAARIFLKVTNVRAERLQDISQADAEAEGVKIDDEGMLCWDYLTNDWLTHDEVPEESFKTLWQSINGRESWEANPWVWVYEFEQIEKPKDCGNE